MVQMDGLSRASRVGVESWLRWVQLYDCMVDANM